jgi:2-iminobutanoate/2-iminopropanoate deaminase
MRLERVQTAKVAEPGPGLWSNCMRAGDQVFLAGFVAMDNDGNIVGEGDPGRQAEHIFETMRHYMESAGGSLAGIATITVFVTDMKYRPAVLAARRKFFSGDFPCSTLVAVTALIDPRLLVEINAIGFLDDRKAG